MPTLSQLVRAQTALGDAALAHLHRVVADWRLLADLSFADLVLYVATRDGGWVAVAQQRPTTGPTSLLDDVVGVRAGPVEQTLLATAWREQRICREGDPVWQGDLPVREEAIPVRGPGGQLVAVVARRTNLAATRAPSRLEIAYLRCADDLVQMLFEGRFPFGDTAGEADSSPRVGDGIIRLDEAARVVYASPNALSAYRRLGLTADLHGADLPATTAALAASDEPVDAAVAGVLSGRSPREAEVEVGGAAVQLRVIPLLPGGTRVGALVLVRDVTEVRRRDRALLSKDATIREIHHRVKNNLQTVAALLRLQARRVSEDSAAREALEEAVRRVASIALVHETLAVTLDESVDFDGIADALARGVNDIAAAGAPVRVARSGRFGALPAAVATPLAMVLNELLHNAAEHGYGDRGGTVELTAQREAAGGGDDPNAERLVVTVTDHGAGLPPGFRLEATTRLGLAIVRTLVESELRGSIRLEPAAGGGTRAVVDVPLAGISQAQDLG